MEAERLITIDYVSSDIRIRRSLGDRLERPLNVLAILLALGGLLFVGWYIPTDRIEQIHLLKSFKTDLPDVTVTLVEVPVWAFPLSAGLLAVGMAGAQIKTRPTSRATVVHLLIALFCTVVTAAYLFAIHQPLVNVLWTVTSPSGRH